MSDEKPTYTVRAITPEDRQTLVLGLTELSTTSRYHRFHCSKPLFSEHELDLLTTCDGHDHIGLIAETFIEGNPIPKGIGTTRVVRDRQDPVWGEIAVVVIDSWQRRGVGRSLLTELAIRCRDHGIDGWTATILGDNQAAIRLISSFGKVVRQEWDNHCLNLRVELSRTVHR